MHRRVSAVLLSMTVCAASIASADTTRSVAVVEFRAGSSAAPEIGTRLARTLTLRTGLAVMTPAAARQEIGPGLDATVKACGDDATCIAALGTKLGVDEVILVGLSELGDVIVTMQRIVVAKRAIEGTMAETLVAGVEPSEADLEKFLRQILPASDFEQYGKIRIVTNVERARVVIGGEQRGVTPLAAVTVRAPASYEVAVEKSGFTDFRANIAVTPNALVVVEPELTRRPSDAWYKKWWVLAIAGAVTATAVGTAVVLSRDNPSDVAVIVEPF